ncbi:DUF4234 domain-containing protein [Gordonia asplenii]|nr:DUF4234 domain-containing protein [Gordonia asplenii]
MTSPNDINDMSKHSEFVSPPTGSAVTPFNAPSPDTGHAPAAVASGLAMKRRNPLGVWIGLPLITLGIYPLVWYYKIHKEMAEFDRRRQIPVAGPMLVLIFLSWTVIAPLISFHNAGARIRDSQRAAGLAPTCSPTLSWVLAFLFGLHTLYMQVELNKIVDRYQVPPHTTVPLYV